MLFDTSSKGFTPLNLKIALLGLTLGLAGFNLLATNTAQAAETTASADVLQEGKKIAFDRKKGNCLACHMIDDGALPGNQGPPLLAMQQRFPNKADLRAQIWDATAKNPQSLMPPFGKHGIISEAELDKVVEYIYSL